MASNNFPCSICEAAFNSPKDLGTHILQQHCEEATPKKEPPEETVIDVEKTLVMDIDPLAHEDKKIAEEQCLDDTIMPVLPRPPTLDEQRQRFIMYNLPTDPANFMR